MAEGSTDSNIMSAVKSLQEQLREQQKVQASILQQLSVLQQGALSASSSSASSSSTPVPMEASDELFTCEVFYVYACSLCYFFTYKLCPCLVAV